MSSTEILEPRELARTAARLVGLLLDPRLLSAYRAVFDQSHSQDVHGGAGKITGGGESDPTFGIITDKRKNAERACLRATTKNLEDALEQLGARKVELEKFSGYRQSKWEAAEVKATEARSARKRSAFVPKSEQLGED